MNLDRERLEAEIAKFRPTFPKALYKYRSGAEPDIATLEQDKIWVPTFENLNDPHDGNLEIKYDLAIAWHEHEMPFIQRDVFGDIQFIPISLSSRGPNDPVPPEVVSEYKKRAEEVRARINQQGVYSLSADPANVQMWTHYANGFRGYCIEYPWTLDTFDPLDGKSPANKVEYVERYPNLDLGHLMREPWHVVVWKLVCHKSKQYEYEQEWRLSFRSGNRTYDHPAPISSIIFGNRTPEPVTRRIQDHFSKRLGQNVSFKVLRPKKGGFDFDVQDLI